MTEQKGKSKRLFQVSKNAKVKSAREVERAKQEVKERQELELENKRRLEKSQQRSKGRGLRNVLNTSTRGEDLGGFAAGPLGAVGIRSSVGLHNKFRDVSRTTIINDDSSLKAQLLNFKKEGSMSETDDPMQSDSDSLEEVGARDRHPNVPIVFHSPRTPQSDGEINSGTVPASGSEGDADEQVKEECLKSSSDDDAQSVDLLEASSESAVRDLGRRERKALFGELHGLLENESLTPYIFQLPLNLPMLEDQGGFVSPSINDDPRLEATGTAIKTEDSVDCVRNSESNLTSPTSSNIPSSIPPSTPVGAQFPSIGDWRAGVPSSSGLVGHLEFYDDGSTILRCGDVLFKAFPGVATSALQHLAYVDDESRTALLSMPLSSVKGDVAHKVTCIPII